MTAVQSLGSVYGCVR